MKITQLIAAGLLAAGLTATATACNAATAASSGSSASNAGSGDLRVAVVFTSFTGGTQGSPCNVGVYNVTLTDQSNSVLGQQTIRSLADQGMPPSNVATSQPYNGAVSCVATLDFGSIAQKSQYGVAVTNLGLTGVTPSPSNTIFFSQADRQTANNTLPVTYSGQ